MIAIIAILAAILFPVFAQARAKAKQAGCLSNNKQLGLALMQYVTDYDDVFPIWDWNPSYNGKYWNQTGYGHQSYLEPYLKSKDVRRCGGTTIGYGTNQKWVNNMFPWALIGIVRPPFTDTRAAKMSDIRAPAHVVYCFDYVYHPYPEGDGQWSFSHEMYWAPKRADGSPNTYFPSLQLRPAHNDGLNYTFADGHAKWFNARDMPFYDLAGHLAGRRLTSVDWPSKQISFDVAYEP